MTCFAARLRAVPALLLCLLCTPAGAGLLDGKLDDDGGFLPVDEAFVPFAELRDGQVHARMQVTEDYYLYRDRFEFTLIDAPDAAFGAPIFPPAKDKEDPYFGTVQIYDESVEIVIPVQGTLPGTAYLDLTFQGCAEAGLCYPPETRRLPLLGPSVTAVLQPAPTAEQQSEQDRLQDVIQEGDLWLVVLTFLGLGILLAFTPCILPTLPILSGLIAGQGKDATASHSFTLSLAYALSMASTLALLGLAAGTVGGNLQAWTQQPWIIVGIATLVGVLAMSMFGLFHLRLPHAIESHIHRVGADHSGSMFGAVLMGMFSTAIVSACAFPAIVAALVVLGERGDRLLGATAMFSLGLGMGIPLVALGTLEGRLLPRAGEWMHGIKQIFGFLLIATAIWLLGRLIPGNWVLILWGVTAIGAGATLGALERHDRDATVVRRLGKAGALMTLIYGLILIMGGFQGATDPFQPLRSGTITQHQGQPIDPVKFQRIKTVDDLQRRLAEAKGPVMLDFYADWCTACKEMEHRVFPVASVAALMSRMTLLQADVTAMDADDRALMGALGVIGPPTMIFYGADDRERTALRLVGALDAEDFSKHLQTFLSQ